MVLTLALGVALVLGGCGPVPKPFKQSVPSKVANPLLELPDMVGITVAPPSTGPGSLTGPLAERTAERLRWAGLPATTGAALTEGYLLEGEADWRDGVVHLFWHLSDRMGRVVAEPTIRAEAARADFEAGADPLIATLAAASASAVSEALRAPGEGRREVGDGAPADVAAPREKVFVMPVSGPAEAPARELTRALRALLEDLEVPLTEREAQAGLMIQGMIADSPPDEDPATPSPIAIEWVLMAPDGAVIGTMRQNNAMAGDPAHRGFGDGAYDITLPVAEAIRDAVR